MAIKAYCKNQTFLLTALDGSKMVTTPNNFNQIDEKFQIDPTFKLAVASGALEVFQTAKQGDKIEKAANEKKPAKGDGGKEKGSTDGTNGGDKGDDAK